MNPTKKYYKRPIFWLIFLFAYAIIICRYVKTEININIGGVRSDYARDWFYGDCFSEQNVQSAARYYMEHGFRANAGLPYYGYKDSVKGNEVVYTHYPPLSEWISGVIATITHSYSHKVLSALPLLLSVPLFFMIFSFLARWLGDNDASFIGATVLVLSNYFICWAGDIHQHLYVEFFKWIFVFLWWWYLTDSKRKYLLPILALCYFAMCLLSFEPYVYIAIVIVGFPLVKKQKLIRWEVALLLLVPIAAFGLRLWLNSLYLGSFHAAINDIAGAYIMRIGDGGGELGRKMGVWDYLYLLPETRLRRLGHFYIFPSTMIVLFYILGMIQLKRHNLTIFKMTLIMYAAALSWAFIMPQHALVHIFTLRHIAIFIGLTIGTGLIQYKNIVINHWKNRKYLMLSVHAILIAYSIFYIGVNTIYFVYLKFGILYPHLGVGSFRISESFWL